MSVAKQREDRPWESPSLCGSKAHGHLCEAKLPPLPPGMVRRVEINAAASFWGYTYQWPDAEMAASLQRVREVLSIAVAQLAIEKARRGS